MVQPNWMQKIKTKTVYQLSKYHAGTTTANHRNLDPKTTTNTLWKTNTTKLENTQPRKHTNTTNTKTMGNNMEHRKRSNKNTK